jgi:hypothetical protein
VQDLQEIKTKLLRGLVENADLINSPMIRASGTVNWAQLQSWKKMKVVDERVPGSINFWSPPPVAGEILPVLQHLDQLTEFRIGTGRAAQGLQPDQLTSVSAVAVAGAQAASQRSLRLTTRTIAELGMRPAFSKLLALMVGRGGKPGENPRAVTGEDGGHQVVDPSAFDPTFGVRSRVGLGAMSLEERKSAHRELIGLVAQLLGAPPPYNQLVDPLKVAALLQQAVGEYRGLGAGRFFMAPEEVQAMMQAQSQQPPPPDPEVVKAQQKAQVEQQKLQSNMQIQSAKLQGDMQSKANREWLSFQSKMAAVQAKERTEMAELAVEAQLEQQAIRARAPSGNGKLPNVR